MSVSSCVLRELYTCRQAQMHAPSMTTAISNRRPSRLPSMIAVTMVLGVAMVPAESVAAPTGVNNAI